MEEQRSISTIHPEVEVEPFSELDIAAAVVYLKKHARHFGLDGVPLAVQLAPLSPNAGWRQAAIEFLHENAKKRAAGIPIVFGSRSRTTPGLMQGVPIHE